MRALTVLYGGSLAPQAFEPALNGKSAFSLALERAGAFPGSEKTLLLVTEGADLPDPPPGKLSVAARREWTVSELCRVLSAEAADFDFAYYGWADSPFLDPSLAGKLAERHVRYGAEYSYADGWPLGLGPELIGSAPAGILFKIAGDDGKGPVNRETLFSILQKDINSFDIETEISPVDLRCHRLSLTADSKRNLLLLSRFARAGCAGAAEAEQIVADHPEFLRTLPAFFPLQVSGPCPGGALAGKTGACPLCPYPLFGARDGTVADRGDFLDPGDFEKLLDKIENFAGDGVIDLSLWGELSLHPRRDDLIRAVLERPALSLVIESSGLGWGALENYAAWAAAAPKRRNGLPPLSWIISLHGKDLPRGKEFSGQELPGAGSPFPESVSFVKALAAAFPREPGTGDRVYVQAVRTAGAEDEIETFYRAWKAYGADQPGPAIIIQKYDSFCGFLPERQAVDLSPVERRPCWHLMRDFPVLIDGTVPVCREDLDCTVTGFPGASRGLGNILREEAETIWNRGAELYRSHCEKSYEKLCARCDEYYTYNF
ncbi:MAG: spiro-SPASM protein [Treponema sp.]|jgi:spiro-SPASM protein|nr:spiro-SPASM protein [Treponema sp.]